MKEYKALFVIDPDKEGSLTEITQGVADTITKSKGKIDKEENWGKQKLSHAISKKKDGIYYKLDFSLDASQVSVLNNAFKLNPSILRVMITVK